MILYYMSEIQKKELNKSVKNNTNKPSEINNLVKSFKVLNISNSEKELMNNKSILHKYNYTKILDSIFNVED